MAADVARQHGTRRRSSQALPLAVDDLDEGEDNLTGYYSLRRGTEPQLRHWKSEREDADPIVQQIRTWLADSENQPGDGSTSIVALQLGPRL